MVLHVRSVFQCTLSCFSLLLLCNVHANVFVTRHIWIRKRQQSNSFSWALLSSSSGCLEVKKCLTCFDIIFFLSNMTNCAMNFRNYLKTHSHVTGHMLSLSAGGRIELHLHHFSCHQGREEDFIHMYIEFLISKSHWSSGHITTPSGISETAAKQKEFFCSNAI